MQVRETALQLRVAAHSPASGAQLVSFSVETAVAQNTVRNQEGT